ncbi:putative Ig domain-containing protein [uncultured Algibacter sp.]|uniref:putative Ig domain-containing protein n=1 Tax=uncultured Algibacter sp. TaxID=298659 RepID=UPI0026181B8E|nr:putative Ig domain-containing protein [uncultured Algibacter sp.]
MKKTILFNLLFVLCHLVQAQEVDYAPKYPEARNGFYILSPKIKPSPKINGANVFGVRPGSKFLYTIPASGDKPMTFSTSPLPKGLSLDSKTGIISGTIENKDIKDYKIVLKAKNAKGKDSKEFTIKVGNTICLTPPLGWNSFNSWARRNVTQERVLKSARAMVDKGLNDFGFSYINIDVGWQGKRGGEYNAIQPNEKFPDIKAMYDEIHALGLKGGIYSSPWITTYGAGVGGSSDNKDGKWDKSMIDPKGTKLKNSAYRRIGKYKFDAIDVKQWVEWGVDYLKYDWQPNDAESIVRMADALDASGRDIVLSLSNNAHFDIIELCKTRVQCWRSGVDLKDRWNTDGKAWNLLQEWDKQRKWLDEGYRGGPGHFPDPDMLVVGDLSSTDSNVLLRPSNLTPDEQYTHITLWTLWASPMLIGCPIEYMDMFTLGLFKNSEVIDVHQDAVAIPGKTILNENGIEIIVKDLENGKKAVGLFNKNDSEEVVTLNFKAAGISGDKKIRDVWRNKDIGTFKDTFSAKVRPHGVVFIKIE